jgi:uncharacterized protein
MPGNSERFMRSLAEAAKAVLDTFKPGKVLYINFLTEIQPECDCMPVADVPVIQDQGILLSEDLVSIEQASIDLLMKSPALPQSVCDEKDLRAGDDILHALSEKPYHLQIDAAVELGLGDRNYQLIGE